MIVDCHAHVFPYIGGQGVYGSVQEHLRYLQRNMTLHPQGGRRFRDNVVVREPTLWNGVSPNFDGLLDVNFRAGKYGRFEWEKEGERYYIQFFPPTLETMEATAERMLAQMQYVGVDRALIQFAPTYGNTDEQMSEVVHRYPDRFRACTVVNEDRADEPGQIESLRHAVLDLGITALYCTIDGYTQGGRGNRLDDEKYTPFWEVVRDLGIPVVWDIRSPMARGDRGKYVEQAVRLRRLVRRFPGTNFVYSHGLPSAALDGAGNFQEEVWALMEEPNVTLELLFPLLWTEWEYPYAEARPMIRKLYDRLGPTKLIWGADMPNVERSCTYRQSLEYLRRYCTFLSDADMETILGTNGNRIYFSLTPAGVAG